MDDQARPPTHFREFGDLLRRALHLSKQTQAWVAGKTEIDKRRISEIVRGDRQPTESQLLVLLAIIREVAPLLTPVATDSVWLSLLHSSRTNTTSTGGRRRSVAESDAAISSLRELLGATADVVRIGQELDAVLASHPHFKRHVPWLNHESARYVTRDCEDRVENLFQRLTLRGGLALLVGDQGSGKTRLAYEVAMRQFSGLPAVIPRQPEALKILAETPWKQPPPRIVIWLDDLQNVLPSPHGSPDIHLLDSTVEKLLTAPVKAAILATIHEAHRAFLLSDTHRHVTKRMHIHAAVRIIDALSEPPVFVRSISMMEHLKAVNLAHDDPWLKDGIAYSRELQFTKSLGRLPLLRDAYDQRRQLSEALIDSLVDLRKLGMWGGVHHRLLLAVSQTYVDATYPREAWERAVADIAQAEPAVLLTQEGDIAEGSARYVLDPYLYKYSRQVSPFVSAAPDIWEPITNQMALIPPKDVLRLAGAALDRLLLEPALVLYSRAANLGEAYASEWAAQIMARRGQHGELRARASTDPCALRWFAASLAEEGDTAEAEEALLEYGITSADAVRAAKRLAHEGLVHRLRSEAPSHDLERAFKIRRLVPLESSNRQPRRIPLPATGRHQTSQRMDRASRNHAMLKNPEILDRLETLHIAGHLAATYYLARSLGVLNRPREGLEVLQPLLVAHDEEAIRIAQILLLVSSGNDTAEMMLPDRTHLDRVIKHSEAWDYTIRRDMLTRLIVREGFSAAVEALLELFEETNMDALGATLNLRRFGFDKYSNVAKEPE